MSTFKFMAAALTVGAATILPHASARAGQDCFNGPVTVDGAQRAQFTVPQGHAVRLKFDFNALYENEVWVCDALTGEQILKRGNYSHGQDDWVSPIDNTKSLAYYIVGFHKMARQTYKDAYKMPWLQSPLRKNGESFPVDGEGGAHVQVYGFNDGGGNGWNNAVVTAYFIGTTGKPGLLPNSTVMKIRALAAAH